MEERREPSAQKARKALDVILEERDHQRRRWTMDKERTLQDWACILGTWTGKVHSTTYNPTGADTSPEARQAFKKRVTQLGAICLAALEAIED
jgi:hypothetical protein